MPGFFSLMSDLTIYVKSLEEENMALREENHALQEQINALEEKIKSIDIK